MATERKRSPGTKGKKKRTLDLLDPYQETEISHLEGSLLGEQIMKEVKGAVVHSTVKAEDGTIFRLQYYTSECFDALQKPEVADHLDRLGFKEFREQPQWGVDVRRVLEYVQSYQWHTHTGTVSMPDGTLKEIKLDEVYVRAALRLPRVQHKFTSGKNLKDKLAKVCDIEKINNNGVPFGAITGKGLEAPARALAMLTTQRYHDRHDRISMGMLAKLQDGIVENWAGFITEELRYSCKQHQQKVSCAHALTKVICHAAGLPPPPPVINPHKESYVIPELRSIKAALGILGTQGETSSQSQSPPQKKQKLKTTPHRPRPQVLLSSSESEEEDFDDTIMDTDIPFPPQPQPTPITTEGQELISTETTAGETIEATMRKVNAKFPSSDGIFDVDLLKGGQTAEASKSCTGLPPEKLANFMAALSYLSQGQYESQDTYQQSLASQAKLMTAAQFNWLELLSHVTETTRSMIACQHSWLVAKDSQLEAETHWKMKLKEENAQLKETVEQTNRSLAEALQAKDKLTARLKDAKKIAKEEQEQLKIKLDAAEQATQAEKQKMEGQIAELTTQLRSAQSEAEAAKTLTLLSHVTETTRSMIACQRNWLVAKDSQLEAETHRKMKLKEENAQLKATVEQANRSFAEALQAKEKLTARLKDAKKAAKKEQGQLKIKLDGAEQAAQAEKQKMEAQITELTTQLRNAQGEAEAAKSQAKAAQESTMNIEKVLFQTERQLKDAKVSLVNSKEETAAVYQRLRTIESDDLNALIEQENPTKDLKQPKRFIPGTSDEE